MKPPEITALQFAVLGLLFSGEKSGQQLQRMLRRHGGPRTAAAFSQLIGRMQRAVYIDVMRENRPGRRFSECRCRVTDLGVIVWQAARHFYDSFDPPPADLQSVQTEEAQFAHHPPTQRTALVKKKCGEAFSKFARRALKGMRQ